MLEKNKVMLEATLSIKDDLTGSLGIPVERIYPDLEDVTIKPSTEEQKWKSKMYGYNEITVEPVTSEIDEDIQPENIKAGTNILGVEGAFVGIDTSDATAVSDDILEGKTAYTNNEKITGTMSKYDGSYEGNADGGIVITDASYLFYNGARTEHIDELLSFCEEITSAKNMFSGCANLTELDVSKLDTSKCTNMSYMFHSCSKLTELDVSKLDTSNVTNMDYMFNLCSKLTELDVSKFDTSNVTNMYRMFGSMNISKIDLSNFNTSKCINMSQMFYASDFTEINLSSFDTSKVTNMSEMFYNCKITDLRLLDTSSVNSIGGMFSYCRQLVNLGGFLNLGKAYTSKSNNYSAHKLNLSSCTELTHESLMNVINNLYDLNLTYDVANGGTLYRQSFQIGTTNMAKLTEEEIQIAIDKGWNVS